LYGLWRMVVLVPLTEIVVICSDSLTVLFPQRFEELFEAVDLYFVECGEEHAEFAGREAFAGEPFEVAYGEVAERGAFVFSKGHFHVYQGNEKSAVGHGCLGAFHWRRRYIFSGIAVVPVIIRIVFGGHLIIAGCRSISMFRGVEVGGDHCFIRLGLMTSGS